MQKKPFTRITLPPTGPLRAPLSLLRHGRMSSLTILIAVALVGIWGASSHATNTADAGTVHTAAPQSLEAVPSPTPSNVSAGQEQQPSTATDSQSTVTSNDSSTSSQTQASVESTDAGTTVTVNGSSQTVPPGQPINQTYVSQNGNGSTSVSISASNSSTGTPDGSSQSSSSRHITLNMQSESRSSSSDISQEDSTMGQ